MAMDPIVPRDPNQRIDELERNLYSRDAAPITIKKRPELSAHGASASGAAANKAEQYGWRNDEKEFAGEVVEAGGAEKMGGGSSFATKVLLGSALFFIVAAGIAGYIILGGFNIISSKNVDISLQGPIAVAAGEPLSLDILVKNNNSSVLDSGTIFVEYPDGTRMAADVTKELHRDQIPFQTVNAGGVVTETIKPVLFGEKDSVKTIKVSVDYKARGSNANFSKEKTFDITIKSSPVIMTASVPSEVNAGQEIEIKVDVGSNSNTLVRNLLVRAEYPFGFTFTGATPAPAFDKNVWQIGDLNPTDQHTIVIRGRMDGQNEEERTFRFALGSASPTDDKQLAVTYITDQHSLFIKKAFIGLTMKLNGRTGEVVVAPGERVQGTLIWSNNLPVAITDMAIAIKLSGKGLDRSQVSAVSGGFFRSVDNTIVWDQNSLSDLRSIEPGQTGEVSFNFSVLPNSQQLLSQGRNISIALDAAVTGTRVQAGAPQEVRSGVSGLAKVGTGLVINAKSVRSVGPFTNTGPIPPRAEKESTYTVVIDLANSFNDASNIVLSTQLPSYVTWLGKVSPAAASGAGTATGASASAEQVAYDESNRTVTWTMPEIRAGVGYTSAPKEIAFQISFLPSLSQVGTVPNLTGPLSVTGSDRFTGQSIESSKPALTTRTSSDPAFRNGDDSVAR